METFSIGKYLIHPHGKPFIVAELSGNHNKSIDRAFHIIDLAVAAGAHAVKLQTYTADSLTIDSHQPEFVVTDPDSLWKNKTLYQLYQEASTPYEWHEQLFDYCGKKNILCFSTPFDEAAVDFLERFDPPCYKIASFENNYYSLIEKVVLTGKPIIVSVGISTLKEIEELHAFLQSKGAKKYVFLKCTSTYPADPKNTNIATIPYLIDHLKINVGLSDHTMGIGIAIGAVALGCQVIEKHFTDSRDQGGVDSAFSLEPCELKALVDETYRVWQGIGSVSFDLSASEEKSLKYKRSIYVVRDIASGEKFTKENLRIIRPGLGLAPKYFDELLDKTSTRPLHRGEALTWDMVQK